MDTAMDSSDDDTPVPDALEQQRVAVPEDPEDPEREAGRDAEAEAPLGDRHQQAAEADLVEQRQTMPGDPDEEHERR